MNRIIIINTTVQYDYKLQLANIHVLVEGNVDDVAAYKWVQPFAVADNLKLLEVSLDAFEKGYKLNEKFAKTIFIIPEGKHYRT